MTTIASILIAAAVVAAGYALYARLGRRSGDERKAQPRDRRIGEPGRTARFAAVEIKTAADSCAAAKALVGKVLLASKAPALPLKGCDRQCRCAFIKRSDRRQERRRWSDDGIAPMLYGARERRTRRDRRRS